MSKKCNSVGLHVFRNKKKREEKDTKREANTPCFHSTVMVQELSYSVDKLTFDTEERTEARKIVQQLEKETLFEKDFGRVTKALGVVKKAETIQRELYLDNYLTQLKEKGRTAQEFAWELLSKKEYRREMKEKKLALNTSLQFFSKGGDASKANDSNNTNEGGNFITKKSSGEELLLNVDLQFFSQKGAKGMGKNNLVGKLFQELDSIETFVYDVNSKAMLLNFTSEEILDAQEYYKHNKNTLTKINCKQMTAETKEELLKALDNKDCIYSHSVVLLYKGNNRIPQGVANIKPYYVRNLENTLKMRNVFERSFEADLTEAFVKGFEEEREREERAKVKFAVQQLNKKQLEDKIYNNARYEIRKFELNTKDETSWAFEDGVEICNESEMFRALLKEYGYTPKKAKKVLTYIAKELFQINFNEEEFAAADDFVMLYLVGDKVYCKASQLKREKVDGITNEKIITDVYVNICNLKDRIYELPKGTEEYVNVSNSASGVRHRSALFMKKDANTERVLVMSSRGAFTGAMGKKVSRSKTVKNNTRVHNGFAPSAILAMCDIFAMFNGIFGKGKRKFVGGMPFAKFTDEEMLKYLKEYLELKGTCDGISYHIFDKLGDFQGRQATKKCFEVLTSEKHISVMIDELDENPIVFIIGESEEKDKEAQEAVDKMFDDEEYLKGRVIIFKKYGTDKEVPETFSDRNGFKASFDVTRAFEMPVLAFAKPKKCNTSQQAFVKAIVSTGDKAVQWLKTHLEKECQKIVDNFSVATYLNMKDIQDMYFAGSVGIACPEYMQYDSSVKRTKVSLMLNEIAKVLNKFKAPIDNSMNCRAIPDAGALFGFTLLNEDEVFAPKAPAGVLAIIFKYPTIEGGEFAKSTIVGLKEILERINALEASDDVKQGLKDFYRLRRPGTAVMPASLALMRGMAGFDFDFDMLMLVWEESFVELFQDKQTVCHIEPGTSNHIDDGVYGVDTMCKPFIDMIKTTSATVGGITVNYDTVMQLMATSKTKAGRYTDPKKRMAYEKNSCKFLEKVLDYALLDPKHPKTKQYKASLEKIELEPVTDFNGAAIAFSKLQKELQPLNENKRVKKYVGLPEYKTNLFTILPMGEVEEEQLKLELLTCRVDSFNTFEKMIRDIIRMARSHQETTIDSPKTNIFAQVFLNISDFFAIFSRVKYEYRVVADEETGEHYIQKRYKAGKNKAYGDLGKKYYFYDIFAEVRDAIEAKILPQVQDILAEENKYEEFKQIVGQYGYIKYTDLKPQYDLSSMYSDIAIHSMNSTNTSENEKAFITKAYKLIPAVAKHLLETSSDESLSALLDYPIELGKFMTSVAMTTINLYGGKMTIKYKDIKSSYNNICFPKEVVQFAMNICKKQLVVAEPVECMTSVLDNWSTFINGVVMEDDTPVACAKQVINGDFYIQELADGKHYATMSIDNEEVFGSQYIEANQIIFEVQTEAPTTIEKGAVVKFTKLTGDKKNIEIDGQEFLTHHRYLLNNYTGKEGMVTDMLNIATKTNKIDKYGDPIYIYKTVIICTLGDAVIEEIEEEDPYIPVVLEEDEEEAVDYGDYTPEEDGLCWDIIELEEELGDEDIF